MGGGKTRGNKSTRNHDSEGGKKRKTANNDIGDGKTRKKKSTGAANDERGEGKTRKKKSTGNHDSEVGKKRKKKSPGNDDSREKKITSEANNVVVVSERRSTRSNLNVNKSGGENIPKELLSHNTAGPGEKQGKRLNNPEFCDIKGCKIKTSVPVKFDTSYDNTMSYADRCRNVCHQECANKKGYISDFDDTLVYCSKMCKNKGDKYRDEELQNEKPKRIYRLPERKLTTTTTTTKTPVTTRVLVLVILVPVAVIVVPVVVVVLVMVLVVVLKTQNMCYHKIVLLPVEGMTMTTTMTMTMTITAMYQVLVARNRKKEQTLVKAATRKITILVPIVEN